LAFSAETFQGRLRTARLGRSCRAVPQAGSTIDLAWEWVREGAPHGAVVVADAQTRGRGRLGRAWSSPEGGLWLSLIVRPDLPAEHAGRLGIALALATAQAVTEETGAATKVKWPNDVVLSGRKLGGVLVETEMAEAKVTAAVLSLGLNANVSLDALPAEVRGFAASLLDATGRRFALETLAAGILGHLEDAWPALYQADSSLVAAWQQADALAGQQVVVISGGKPASAGEMEPQGVCAGIDDAGALVLMTPNGSRRITSGEVRSLRTAE